MIDAWSLTKVDLIDDNEWLELVEADIYELIHSMNFNLISLRRVDSLKKVGLNEIRDDIINISKN